MADLPHPTYQPPKPLEPRSWRLTPLNSTRTLRCNQLEVGASGAIGEEYRNDLVRTDKARRTAATRSVV
jgi:hypothetical protein